MGRFNDGIIKSNLDCIGCNRCVTTCPVLGANVTTTDKGVTRVEVSAKKCIECGNCIKECSHHARSYRDDTIFFAKDLEQGKEISVIVDPTFYTIYGENAPKILGYLKARGVKTIYDGSIGVGISLWGHVRYLKENQGENGLCRAFIAHTCPAVVNYGRNSMPQLLDCIIPIQLPSVCTAIYARKYLNETAPIAYIGPCVAMTSETASIETGKNILYNITFEHLNKFIKDVELDDYYATADQRSDGIGNTVVANGLFRRLVSMFFESTRIFTNYDRLNELFLKTFVEDSANKDLNHPFMTEMGTCELGCIFGSGVSIDECDTSKLFAHYEADLKHTLDVLHKRDITGDRYRLLCEMFADLDYSDFLVEFSDNYRQPYIVPPHAYEDIFNRMHKNTPEKRRINCGSCGYKTCIEMAEAIANGYSKMNNCIHYMNDELENQVYYDNLTGLYTQAGFLREVGKRLQTYPNRKYIIACANLNKFMVVNELYGKAVGDEVLRSFGRILAEYAESHNGEAARLGGGNYLIFAEKSLDIDGALLDRAGFDFSHIGVGYPLTARFTISDVNVELEPEVGKYIEATIFTMAKITDRSHNTYLYYDDAIRAEMSTEIEITKQMRRALDNNEFKLYFQAQYSTDGKKLVGAEALCRWIKSNGDIISPGIFIPIFEKNGFIKELDRYVWKVAFETIKDWTERGMKTVPISVNVSRVSLSDDGIVGAIRTLRDKYNIDNDMIHFEITESAYMGKQTEMIERVSKIRDMGFYIAMDDFGSGYSSLNALKDVPLDILKLDMGFLSSSDNLDKGKSIIEHMIHMAKSMNLTTIAEGVEEKTQANFFEKIGCDFIQGFLYAKPVSQDEFERLLK